MDCNFPLHIKSPEGLTQAVPCGHCIACRIARVRDWSVRLLDESSTWEHSSFITLTYSDEFLPVTNCGKATLVKSDLQKFFKRLREALPYSIKYFACGEMGDHTNRPHYHAIVFGLDPKDSDIVEREWTFGFVVVESVNIQRIKYVCGYVEKKMYYNPKDNFKDGYGCLQPPFQLISKGLGLKFFEANIDRYMVSKRKTINGVSYSFPRYYLKKHPEFKESMSEKSYFNRIAADQKAFEAIMSGYDLVQSRLQRDMDLRVKARMKKGTI